MEKQKATFLSKLSDPTSMIEHWNFFEKMPMGKCIFSKLVGWAIPYTGSVSPRIKRIAPGDIEIILRDRRKIRNHLNSVHAIALANIGEFASGLALFSKAPKGAIAIITKLEIDYLKKARGDLLAHAQFAGGIFQNNSEFIIKTEIKDGANEIVAVTHATWRIRIKSP